jgi:membrane-bound metal-dependent hydrolase YbcI (DUF457 family)
MEWFQKIIDFLSLASDARALAIAILGGLFFTQFLKFQLPPSWSDQTHARSVRSISVVLTMAICWILWPRHELPVLAVIAFSLVAGMATPTLYWLAVKYAYRKWPQLNDMLSARPDAGKTS